MVALGLASSWWPLGEPVPLSLPSVSWTKGETACGPKAASSWFHVAVGGVGLCVSGPKPAQGAASRLWRQQCWLAAGSLCSTLWFTGLGLLPVVLRVLGSWFQEILQVGEVSPRGVAADVSQHLIAVCMKEAGEHSGRRAPILSSRVRPSVCPPGDALRMGPASLQPPLDVSFSPCVCGSSAP